MAFQKGHPQYSTYRFPKGYSSWNKGKSWSNEIKEKISLAKKGRRCSPNTEFKKGENHWLGRKHNEESKKKMGEARVGKYSKNYYRKIGILGVYKQQNYKNPTSIEEKVYEELKNRGLLFEKQKIINRKFVVDAYIPSLNLVIEADGDYWHSLERVKKRDKAKNAYLIKCGFKLLRLKESEIRDNSFINKLEVN